MKLSIQNIIDKHKGCPCLVLGHGPSLNIVKEKLSVYKEKGYILIATNDWYNFYDVIPNYTVVCNHIYSVSREYSNINKYNVTYIYAEVQDLTSRGKIEQVLKVDYLPYDFRHFNNKTCPHGGWKYCQPSEHHDPNEAPNCCAHFIPGRLSIQEELQKYTAYKDRYGMGDVNVLRQLTFGILMGCNPVYMCGIDLDYRQGYSSKVGYSTPNVSEYQTDMALQKRIHSDFFILNESAKNKNVKIINTNPNLIYNEFEKGIIL